MEILKYAHFTNSITFYIFQLLNLNLGSNFHKFGRATFVSIKFIYFEFSLSFLCVKNMKYESWFTLPLVIMLQCAIFADNLYKNLLLFFMKNVLRKRDYFIGHKFPYVMKDMEPRLSKELENDFTGLLKKLIYKVK